TSGSSRTGSFTITPAPGALALLGLAGLAGRRKRA
ncbi:MAG: GlyGly-CTERM sorting domain-containing protein, partial [Phycisphaera sp.]|nr:GlyGly-CTERM sorting domain-containing protein [Phycisphaera sp.]